jgi:hypothetical protein
MHMAATSAAVHAYAYSCPAVYSVLPLCDVHTHACTPVAHVYVCSCAMRAVQMACVAAAAAGNGDCCPACCSMVTAGRQC